MSKNYSNELNLLIPVYRGGDLFLGAIQSVEESSIPFKNIFISFNGNDSSDYDVFLIFLKEKRFKKNYTIFQTEMDLSSRQHALFMVEKLTHILSPSSKLMMLAHDDRLLVSGNSIPNKEFFNNLSACTIYVPSYSFCWAPEYDVVTKFVGGGFDMTPEHFFWKSMKENIPTNMSGMIVPFFAFVEAQNTLSRYGNGARFEHILCIASLIRHVRFVNEVHVLIGERMNSDGRILTVLDHRRAALHYMMAYLRYGRLRSPKELPKFLTHFFRKMVGYWLARLKIN